MSNTKFYLLVAACFFVSLRIVYGVLHGDPYADQRGKVDPAYAPWVKAAKDCKDTYESGPLYRDCIRQLDDRHARMTGFEKD